MSSTILQIEDTPSLAMLYESALVRAGHDVRTVETLSEARMAWKGEARERVVLLDLLLPDGDGLEFLREAVAEDPDVRIIVITANGSINLAVEAMRRGAFDFLVKPFDIQRLVAAVQAATRSLPAVGKHEEREEATGEDGHFEGFIGSSKPMQEIYRTIRSIGRSTATVFLTGESGTGKEVAAEAIHQRSPRATGPFVALNCGAIPKDLLESEVFGHLRGSFTGALADRKGAAEAAHGGTLFLDEICEMDLALQTKLLRFLQTSAIQPVGSVTPRKVDVRIVCATNRDPLTRVREGLFREDLYYRLHVVPVRLPPLRDRGSDVIEIASEELRKIAREEGKAFVGLSDETAEIFRNLLWPGNVRQLLNVLRNVVVLHDGRLVEPYMLPPGLADASTALEPIAGLAPNRDPIAALVGRPLGEVERELIEATIRECGGSIPRAARLLELSPSTIYRKRESWDLKAG